MQPGDYDLVYNTVPHMIFTKRELQALRRDTVLVDLASFPGGVDTLMATPWELRWWTGAICPAAPPRRLPVR